MGYLMTQVALCAALAYVIGLVFGSVALLLTKAVRSQ